jgi:predicted GNAT family acetyltransferase
MTEPRDRLVVSDNPEESRFEGRLDDRLVAFSEYDIPRADVITFLHTEVEPEFEGQGLGSVLASSVLDQVRARGLRVVARCPFIAAYIRRHRKYADLLLRSKLGRTGDEAPT